MSTRWGIVASGQGANRIGFLYYAKYRNPAIDDRVLLLNTTPADVKPEKPLEKLFEADPELREVYESIRKRRVCIFGRTPSGAGNNWTVGEREAMDDFHTIRRYIASLNLRPQDVLLGIATLGGGTGNGSLPYIIHRMRTDPGVGMEKMNNFLALGILPYDFEAPQRHFNAVCGMSRLLRYAGRQNAALLILVDNSQVERVLGLGGREDRYMRINSEIIRCIHMLIAPSIYTSSATIDIADYYQLPSSLGITHFTPCMSWGNDPEVMGIEAMLESASANPLVPLDRGKATMAYVILAVPESAVLEGTLTQEMLEEEVRSWAERHLAGGGGGLVRYASLVAVPEKRDVDVLILLGGFSLRKLMEKLGDKYHKFRECLTPRDGAIEQGKVEEIERELRRYIAETERRIEALEEGTAELERWGFGDV